MMKTRKKLTRSFIILIILQLLIMIPAAHATGMSGNDSTAYLKSILYREGGAEASGTLSQAGEAVYDQTRYIYNDPDNIGDNITKIVEDVDGNNCSNALYSLDAYSNVPNIAEEYTNTSDFFDSTDINVKSLELGVQFNTYPDAWEQNYNSLKWLFRNIYLRHQTPEQKDAFLEKVFQVYLGDEVAAGGNYDELLDGIKSLLTDDDIEIAQQLAIWHFTKGEYVDNYYEGEWFNPYDLMLIDGNDNELSYYDITDGDIRVDYINSVYSYLIDEALANAYGDEESTFPTVVDYGSGNAILSGNYYEVGPFEVDDLSGMADPSTYSIKLVDETGTEIDRSDYIIKVDGQTVTDNVDEILDQEFYVYLPDTTDVTEVTLQLSYEDYNTEASLWKQSVVNVDTYPPVILLTRELEEKTEEQTYTIERPGQYSIQIIKQDSETEARLEDAEFSVNINYNGAQTYETNENGIIAINNIEIQNEGTDYIVISETTPPPNYDQVLGSLIINANKQSVNGILKIQSIQVPYPITGMTVSFNPTTQVITVTVSDEELTASPGSYNINLEKIDKEDDTPLSGAEFEIEVNGVLIESSPGNTTFVSGSNGKLTIPTQTISGSSADVIKITETEPPSGYAETDEVLEITVNKEVVNNTYQVASINSVVKVNNVVTPSENITASYNSQQNTINISEKNEVDTGGISGSYALEVIKVDENDNPINNYTAKFGITVNNGTTKEVSTVNSVANYGTVKINSIDNPDTITIQEINPPDGYNKLINSVTVSVAKTLSGESYIATGASSLDSNITASFSNNKVTVRVKNQSQNLGYTVYYKEQGTNKTLADPKTVSGKTIGNIVNESAVDVLGYAKLEPSNTNITITSGTNEYTFFYEIETYDITYNYNGGTLPSGKTNAEEYTVETENITINNPEKQGYTFLGWTEGDLDEPELIKVIEKGSTGNIELTANWEPNTYNITLNNGSATTNGTGTIYEVYENNIYLDSAKTKIMTTAANGITIPQRQYTVTYNHNYTGSTNTTRSGTYTFVGYYDGETQMISAGGFITSAFTNTKYLENKTLEASWSGGEATYIPSRNGYTFEGWFEDENCTGTRVDTNGSYIPTENKTLYAKWTANTYNITLDNGNATTNGTGTIYEVYGTNIYLDNEKTQVMTMSNNAITKPQREYTVTYKHKYEGSTDKIETGTYTFDGYYDGEAQMISSGGFITSAFTNTKYLENKTLAANWSGGEITYIPLRTGYTFEGWFEDENCTGTRVDTNGTYKPTENKTLYAKWTANIVVYTVNHWTQKVTGDASQHNETNYKQEKKISSTAAADSIVTPALETYEGFTPPSTQTVTVSPDGSLVVDYYYTRNSYNVTLNKGTGIDTVTGSGTYLYEAPVTITATPKTGYHWKNWTGTHSDNRQNYEFQMPAANVEDTANGEANTYTVVYNGNGATSGNTANSTHTYDVDKNLNINGYERKYIVTFDHNYTGSTDTIETATYTFKNWNEQTNGSGKSYENNASVKNLTDENNGTVEIYAQWNSGTATCNPTRQGYTFIGWFEDENCTGTRVDTNGTYTPTQNKTLYAKWTADGVGYKVNHWKQKLTGNASQHDETNYTKEYTQDLIGEADSTVTPAIKTYDGFTSPSTQTVNVNSDGSLVVDYYYTRNSYQVTLSKGTGIDTVLGAGTYLYEEPVTINATLNAGYHWKNWTGTENSNEINHSFTMPASNVTDTANGEANTYWVSYNGNGETGGSTPNSTHVYDVEKALTPNGYERKYEVTFKHNYSEVTDKIETATYTFNGWNTNFEGTGESYSNNANVINLIATNGGTFNLYANWISASVTYNPTRQGYTFIGWFEDEACSGTRVDTNGIYTPTENKTLYAKWTANAVEYNVEHWQQDVDGNASQYDETNYTRIDSYSFEGEADSTVTPEVKTYTGFTSPSAQTVTVSPDGSLVVKYYYTRNSYTVTLNKGTGIDSVAGTGTYLYEEPVTVNATLKTGYHWKNWTGTHSDNRQSYEFQMPASNVIDTAIGEANTYTVVYNGNGATGGNTESSTHTYDVEKALTSNGFTRNYTVEYKYKCDEITDETRTSTYTFNKWNTNSEGTGTSSYNNNQTVKNLSSINGATTTLYAIWNAEELNNSPTRVGYKFDGWFENEGCTGERVDTNGTYTPLDNKVLYAKWSADMSQTKEIKYTVKYYKDNELVETKENKENVYVLAEDTLELDRTLINNNNKYDGYTIDRTEPETVEDIVHHGDVIEVYYVKRTDLSYTIHYYEENSTNEVFDTKQETNKTFGTVVTEVAPEKEGYEVIAPASVDLTIGTGENVHTFYYRKKPVQITIKYMNKLVEGQEISTQETVSKKMFDNYDVSDKRKELENYEYIDSSGNETGRAESENIEVVFYYIKKAKIIVNHIDMDKETDNIMQTDLITGKVGDVKTTTEREIEGYVLERRPDVETITMTEEVIEVNYYYTKIKGFYDIELTSCNKKDSNEKLQGITFSIQIGDGEAKTLVTNENGVIELKDVLITAPGTERIIIREISTREDYNPLIGELQLDAKYEKDENKYKIYDFESISNNWNSEISLEENTLKIQNKHEKLVLGSYNLTVESITQDGDTIIETPVEFEINGEQKQAEEGKVNYSNVRINKENVDISDIYEIKEISVPDKYKKYNGKVKLEIVKKLSDDETEYEVQDVIMIVENENGEEVVSPTEIILDRNGDNIVLKIKNYEDIDLVLKTFISSVSEDNTFDENDLITGDSSREPIVEIGEDITFNQSAEELEVKENDYLLYKIRIYNTGNVNAYASQISTYLPEDLEFVADAEQNGIWTYDGADNKVTTNENYNPEIIEKYAQGGNLEYIELELVLKVKPGAAKDINLNTRTFLVRSNYTDGTNYDDTIEEDEQDTESVVVLDYNHIDLSLKQYIAAISKDQTFEETEYLTGEKSREPSINLEKLDSREEKTAKYNQIKDTIRVREKDYILYKIRIYNEGNLNAMAKKIINYIPSSLEFDNSLESNKIWTYDEETGSVTTNENYVPTILTKHEKGQDLKYQELDLILRVKEDAVQDIRLNNVAEIIESTDETENITEDRDSMRNINNIEDYDTNVEDDSDYESVIVAAIYGNYDLNIIAVDQENNLINKEGTKFNVNNVEKQTEEGKVSLKDNIIVKTNVENIDTYLIEVKDISKDFIKFDGTIKLEIAKKISEDETKYEIDRENTKITILNSDNEEINVEGIALEIETKEEKEELTLKIVNFEKVDMSLRKYVAAVSSDENFEEAEYLINERSRVPVISTEELDNGSSTTAKYTHNKEALGVKRNNYILYKIRVYNEGNKDGYVDKIIEYLPEELTFIKAAKENEIWNYDETTRKLTTNEKYEPKTLVKHTAGQELDYQEVSVVAKVKAETEELVDITNIAEIAEIKYADGKEAQDRDSTVGTIAKLNNLRNYNIARQEDDEDFDKIEVTPNTGTYDIEIVKADKSGNKITTSNATINVNGEDKNTNKGILTIPNIQINKSNLNKTDLYEIVEIKAPDGYARVTSNINVSVTKKESADRSKYEVDTVSMEIVTPYGDTYESNKIKIENRNGKTVIVITIENEKIAEAPSGGQNNGNSSGQTQPGTGSDAQVINNKTIINNIPTSSGTGSTSTKTDGSSNKVINVKSTSNSEKEDVTTASATGDEIPGIVLNVIFLVVVANIVQMRIYKKKCKKIIK